MTSPAITKSPKPTEKKSPTHSTNGAEAPTAAAATGTAAAAAPGQQPEAFSWLRVFKLADLMMKQGC